MEAVRTAIEPELFERIRAIAYERAGIDLRDGKEALVEARLGKRMRALGLSGFREYVARLKSDENEIVQFLDALSTNFTSFFRERDHFDVMSDEIVARVRNGARKIRLWCAAAATGEEPWTTAMVLHDKLGDDVDWRLLATDISTRALGIAQAGRYPRRTLDSVPAALRERYFRPVETGPGSREGEWEVAAVLRERVSFARLNLATPPFPMRGPLDIVMCRNVMIYFDIEVRTRLVLAVKPLLSPGGLFFLGHSETLNGIESGLTPAGPAVYQRPHG
jgi:chemotaxis protein methyltransferase CheR